MNRKEEPTKMQIIGNMSPRRKNRFTLGENLEHMFDDTVIETPKGVVKPEAEPGEFGGGSKESQSFKDKGLIKGSDFIHFTLPYEFDIAIAESHKGINWYEQNKQVLDRGLHVATPLEFMTMFQGVVDSYKNNTRLFDADKNSLKRSVIIDLYKFLTSDYTGGSWCNLNALFRKDDNKCKMLQAVRVDTSKGSESKDQLIYSVKTIQTSVTSDCFVDFSDLTSKGLPKARHSTQSYLAGDNIYFYHPRNNAVARFYADPDFALLDCSRYPQGANAWLGVREARTQSSC